MRLKTQLSRSVQHGTSRMEAAEAKVKQASGTLEVHRMAAALAPPSETDPEPGTPGTLSVTENVVRIGHLNLPRRADPADGPQG